MNEAVPLSLQTCPQIPDHFRPPHLGARSGISTSTKVEFMDYFVRNTEVKVLTK